MFSSLRTRLWSTIAVLGVLLLALTGLAGPAQALTARSVSVKVAPANVLAGQTVTFSGTATRSPKGSVVRIQRKSGKVWVTAGQTRTTTAGGAYRAAVKLPSTPARYTYRAFVPKTSKLAAATSRTVVVGALRRTSIALTVTPATITAGQSSRIAGSVSPFTVGTRVSVQRLSGSSWVQVGTPALSSSGGYFLDVKPTVTTRYRVVTPLNGVNASAVSVERNVVVTAANAPVITTTSLPNGEQNLPYTTTLTKTGGAGTWSVPAGTLPGGLSLDPATGVLSGTPTGSGTRNLFLIFTETSGPVATKTLPITIVAAPTITTPTVLPDAHRGGAYSVTFTKTGGPGTWTPAVLPGGGASIPAGFSLDPATGTLTGTPTVAGVNALAVTFTQTNGNAVTKIFSLTVLQPKITTTSIPDAVTGTPYSFQFTKTGLDGTWTSTSLLPTGITLSPAGLLSGTPTEVGDTYFQVVFTETSTGAQSKLGFVFHVADPGSPTITTTSLPAGVIGTAYTATLAATPTGGTWSVTQGSLPVGLTLNPTTGAITGTPSVAEDAQFIVTYTQGATKNTKLLRLVVAAAG